jgi:hypothetical protein
MFLICTCTVGCLLAGAIVFSQLNPAPVTPQVEIDARFNSADSDKNGSLSKEEFGKYLKVLQRTAAGSGVKICAKTGQPCSHSGGTAGKEGGCCGGKNKGEAGTAGKEGGCCGGKNKGEADTAGKEGGCCGGKNKGEAGTAGKEGGCCGGKDKPSVAGKADHTADHAADHADEPVLTASP